MNTPQLVSVATVREHALGVAPYSGPERRLAGRRSGEWLAIDRRMRRELGPYFPERRRPNSRLSGEPWRNRTTPGSTARSQELPSITAYLDEVTDVADDSLIPFSWLSAEEPHASMRAADVDVAEGVDVTDASEDSVYSAPAEAFEDAGADLRALAHTMPASSAGERDRAHTDAAAGSNVTSFPMWSDDDMPNAVLSYATLSLEERATGMLKGGELGQTEARGIASPASASTDQREGAARTLELVAQRVRAGELRLSRFRTDLGEAAALATVLAAMLGANE